LFVVADSESAALPADIRNIIINNNMAAITYVLMAITAAPTKPQCANQENTGQQQHPSQHTASIGCVGAAITAAAHQYSVRHPLQ
jgi:hypothetical protein